MASTPPFTPPPPPGSFSSDPRQQKAYWRAQKAAARTQRDYWRAQRRDQRYYWQSMHRPSIAGPIVLLAIGTVALLITAGKLSMPAFWEWFVRWWPMLLIGLGLISLAEWFLDRDQPYRRTRGTVGLVVLIFFFAAIGYAVTKSKSHLDDLGKKMGIDDPGEWSFSGDEHERDTDSSVSVPANSSVTVQNPRGDVTITGSVDKQIHVHAHQIVNANSDSDAAGVFPALDPKVSVSGNSVLVRVESRNNARVLLTIEQPEGSSSDVTAGRGDVSVEGLKGASTITSGHGDVKLSSIGGSVHVHMNKGDFSAHEVGGAVSLDGHFDDVTISEVTGTLAMEGDFFGDTHLEEIGSNVHFHSSRTDLDIARLAGELTMDSDDLHIGQAIGPLRVVTRSKNITCSQVSGDVHIENENGEVTVNAAAPLGNIQIDNSSDPVTLTLPPDAGFSINATTTGGDLDTDFPLNVTGNDEHRNANGTVGKGGPKIEVNARHGDISIKKGELNPPPIPPAPISPKMTEPPSGPVKHLHAPPDSPTAPKVL